jgi:pyrimidine operon attenuation protein/uracil phosphoribosyltransferase
MRFKSQLMTSDEIKRAVKRIAHQIDERNKGGENVAIVGIANGGIPMARALSSYLMKITDCRIPTGIIDISMHRDDIGAGAVGISPEELASPKVCDNPPKESEKTKTMIPFDVEGKNVVLVDDVLYTGRSVRAALDALSERGRPATVQLAVLIDRGHRELPVHADYVGKNIPTSHREIVKVIFDDDFKSPTVNIYDL